MLMWSHPKLSLVLDIVSLNWLLLAAVLWYESFDD